jgi:ribosomal protein S18 acetylase RimI-like enzyme
VFKREFQKPPIEIGDKIASVEFVATASKFRGKGVASAIMNYLFTFPQYNIMNTFQKLPIQIQMQ